MNRIGSDSPSKIAQRALEQEGIPARHFDSITSTHTVARAMADSDPALIVYLADEQTSGRGRGTNTWDAVPGEALLATWSVRCLSSPGHLLSPLIGLDLWQEAITNWPELAGTASIKPPNDLYLRASKVAGLLIEVLSMGPHNRVLIGLGMNWTSHPVHLASATSLSMHTSRPLTPPALTKFIQNLTLRFVRRLDQAPHSQIPLHDLEPLTQAVRQNPIAGLGLVRLHTQGDIEYTDRTVPWQTL